MNQLTHGPYNAPDALRQPPLRVLYIGPLLPGSTTVQRARALSSLGHHLTMVNTAETSEFVAKPCLPARVMRKLCGPRDRSGANDSVIRQVRDAKFDLAWIDKGLTILPHTIEKIRDFQPHCNIIGYSPDDMMNRANQSRQFLAGLRLYDCFITTKSYNVSELETLGCPKVLFIDNSYDPETHKPLPADMQSRARLGGTVGFIGQWEPERAQSLRKLALAGIAVRVWGYTWERMKDVPTGLTLENRPLWGEDYSLALCNFDINLCFLRKCNRDMQTTRTVEIPACGAFMLAERTDEQRRLFGEGQEAAYFGNDDELLDMVRHYLAHPTERQRIAAAGRERCLRGGYSNAERLARVLSLISKPGGPD